MFRKNKFGGCVFIMTLYYCYFQRRREKSKLNATDGDRVSPGTDMQCRGTGVRVLTVRRFLLASTRKSIIHNSLAPNPAGGNHPAPWARRGPTDGRWRWRCFSGDGGEGREREKQTTDLIAHTHTHTHIHYIHKCVYIVWR